MISPYYEEDSSIVYTKTRDDNSKYRPVRILSGEVYVTKSKEEVISTILGSCIAVCGRDPVAGVCGMNHFLLPGDSINSKTDNAARYGAFAMESLINQIIKEGGSKRNLEVKIFGGGNIKNNLSPIGSKNAAFVRDFLKREEIKILSEDLEGRFSRYIHFYTDTGRVMLRKLNSQESAQVVTEEKKYAEKISNKPVEGDIDLF